ncbi:MAG: hypothetical protein KF889_19550 [Alphaproteobacteria bacterium]|nr:hypothetical protein [Alphaproteobacteria bacterium]MCW5744028.1 hypothetical protein [Alphaproteobacteria bacterium]
MAGYAEVLGLDSQRLRRRLLFLNDRAKAHDALQSELHIACAATLRRDAGAIALLLGQTEEALHLLSAAGRQWADLGVYSGYFLMSLARRSRGASWFENDTELDDIERSLTSEQAAKDFSRKAGQTTLGAMSNSSPRQLLSLFQAAGGGRRRSGRASRLALPAAKRLGPSSGTEVGVTGMPLAGYLRLYDAFGTGEVSVRDQDSLFALAMRRDEQISVARADQYHWRLLSKPAEIIDFDLIALGMTAVEAGANSMNRMFASIEKLGTEARLPFELAVDLETRRNPRSKG